MKDKRSYTEWIQKLLCNNLNNLGRDEIEISNIKVFYYENGVGFWPPNFADEKCMTKCAVPHPVKLPGLFWINENLSLNYQGWAEGSLEVADYVLDIIKGVKSVKYFSSIPNDSVVIDGRVIYVKKWMESHPGSKKAIEKNIGKNITKLFLNIHAVKSGSYDLILPFQKGFMI